MCSLTVKDCGMGARNEVSWIVSGLTPGIRLAPRCWDSRHNHNHSWEGSLYWGFVFHPPTSSLPASSSSSSSGTSSSLGAISAGGWIKA
ncbi:transposon factor [Moniliophthora roreri]|nr:transposon factor [Moniliophthora roreri]